MIGKMDQRIVLQRRTEVADGVGGVTRSWGTIATVWSAVKARGGRESLDEGRVNATFVVVFTIYNRDDLSETDRILWNGETYNIRGILRTGARELRLQIEAERGAAE